MMPAQERYYRDAAFKQLVDVIYSMIYKAEYTPTEIREAAMLAAIMVERHNPRRLCILRDDLTENVARPVAG